MRWLLLVVVALVPMAAFANSHGGGGSGGGGSGDPNPGDFDCVLWAAPDGGVDGGLDGGDGGLPNDGGYFPGAVCVDHALGCSSAPGTPGLAALGGAALLAFALRPRRLGRARVSPR